MVGRPYGSGQMKVSLVSFGIQHDPAMNSRAGVTFHRIDRETGKRVHHRNVVNRHEPVENAEIVKGTSTRKGSTWWSSRVKTVSTFPPPGLFAKDAETIARSLASKKVSPKGPGSGMRMSTFFINRAGKNLSEDRKEELEKAKVLLSERVRAARVRRAKQTA